MEGSIFLQVLLYAAGSIAGIWFGIHSAKEAIISNSHSSNTMIGDGKEREKERAKKLEKEPASDPVASNTGNGSAGNMFYSQPQLPDMRGVDYSNSGNMPSTSGTGGNAPASVDTSSGGGGGFGINVIVGGVNGIGAIAQSGEVSNRFVAARQIIGPMRQSGMVYNIKPRGTKVMDQIGSNITNTITQGRLTINQGNDAKTDISQGKFKINQGNGVKTAISQGRVDVKPLGNASNYISGDVKSLKAGKGDFYTPNLKINGIAKASLLAQKFVAPKRLRIKAQKVREGLVSRLAQNGFNTVSEKEILNQQNLLANGNEMLDPEELVETKSGRANISNTGKRIIINFNTFKLQNSDKMKYTSSIENLPKMLSLEEVISDPQNKELTTSQLGTLAGVYRQTNLMSISDNSSYQNVLKQVVKERPDLKNSTQIMMTADRALQLVEDKKRNRQSIAAFMTNKRKAQEDLQVGNMNYLNRMIISDSEIANQFNNFTNEAYRKEVEKRARENIEKRSHMSLEEKEKEHEKEMKRLMESGDEVDRKVVEELIKERVLTDPEGAKNIIGEKGANEITDYIRKEKEKAYQRNLERQEKVADNEFRKANDQYKDSSIEDVREARIKAEMKEAIDKAVEEMKSHMKKDSESKRVSFEEYVERKRNEEQQYQRNINQNTIQSTSNSSIYIPRPVQERMAKSANS